MTCDRPLVIELCCGTALLSSVAQEAGYAVLPIDWGHNKHKPYVRALHMDLRQASTWTFLRHVCETRPIAWIHVAPPCGTASRARDIGKGPRPLRSVQHVMGLPGLDTVSQERVNSANVIYAETASFCSWLLQNFPSVPFSVENPLHSYMWQIPAFEGLRERLQLVVFDSCRHGSKRKKATAFLTNHAALHSLSGPCPGCLVHEKWGRRTSDYATAEEAAYPRLLCQRIVACVDAACDARCLLPARSITSSLHAARVAAQSQPRGRRCPPLLSEFAHTVTVRSNAAPPLDDKRQLRVAWRGVAAGSKLLRELMANGDDGTEQHAAYTFGVYRNFQAYIAAASLLVHPFDVAKALPDGMLRAVFTTLTEGPVATIRHRLSTLKKWTAWAKELETAESALRDSMRPSVRGVVGNKRIKLLQRIAESLSRPDRSLFDEMAQGFMLTGYMRNTGVFSPDVKPATVAEDEFWLGAQHMRQALWDKVESHPLQSYSQELWDLTIEEASPDKRWLEGPLARESLDSLFEGEWSPCRRFAVWQGKYRPIDDFSECRVNACFGCFEKITLKALDELVWTCALVFRVAQAKGSVRLELGSGEVLEGPLHKVWHDPSRVRPHTKTYDLRSAYKQLAIHPSERRKAVLLLKCPSTRKVSGFVCNTLPFGGSSSVMHFNRVGLLLQRILWELLVVASCYYDDYPCVTPAFLASNTDSTTHAVAKLLGFSLSEKERPFSTATETLGVVVDTCDPSMAIVKVSNKPDRCKTLASALCDIMASGELSAADMPATLGRLQFAEAQILGRTGKLALADLRSFEARAGKVILTDDQIDAMSVLRHRLMYAPARSILASPAASPTLVFTDGACEPSEGGFTATVGGVLLVPSTGLHVPRKLVGQWAERRKHVIGQIELYAVVLARVHWAKHLGNARVVFFVDHSGVLSACINGCSHDTSWRKLLLYLEEADESAPCLAWWHRVPSASNVSDPPSRGKWGELDFLGDYTREEPACFVTGELLRPT